LYNILIFYARTAWSVKRLARGWTVRGSNPGLGYIFRTCSDWSWSPPASYTMGKLSVIPEGKAVGAWH